MKYKFTDIEPEDSSAHLSQIDFTGAVNGTSDRGNEWDTVSKITKSFITYPYSLILSTKPALEDMDCRLDGVSAVQDEDKEI